MPAPPHPACPLSLSVPEGLKTPSNCELVVGGEPQCWAEGRCLLFDDSFLHTAFHEGKRNAQPAAPRSPVPCRHQRRGCRGAAGGQGRLPPVPSPAQVAAGLEAPASHGGYTAAARRLHRGGQEPRSWHGEGGGLPITNAPHCFGVVEHPGAPCPAEPPEPPPQPAAGLAPVLNCSQPCGTAGPAQGPVLPSLPRQRASLIPQSFAGRHRLRCRQPRHPLALARGSAAGCSGPVARQQLSADMAAAPLSPVQGEKLHVSLFCCFSPSLMAAVPLQRSRINRH